MTKFICKACNYRFEAKEAKDCPYCGKGSIEREKSASEILEEIEEIVGE